MNILKKIFRKSETEIQKNIEKEILNSNKPKKLTKTKEKEFFKLIIDEEVYQIQKILEFLKEFPTLANSTVSGMRKGMTGLSSLMLAIRFYDFTTAIKLVELGADVNFIDSSDVRLNHHPVFFDLLQMMRDLIEEKDFDAVEDGFKLWDLMDSCGLDYSLKSICNDGVNKPDSYIQAFIRLVGIKYSNTHLVHNETKYDPPNPYISIFKFSSESRDNQKESYYKQMAERIVDKVNIVQLKEIDANKFRSWSSIKVPLYIENGFIDDFSLSTVNDLTKKKYGFELKNINDINHLSEKINKEITRFANKSYN